MNLKMLKHPNAILISWRISSPNPPSNVWLYPDNCQICGKIRIQIKNVRSTPYKITSFDAASSIKRAAKAKDPSHYCEIENVDLIAKEYKVHKTCYITFKRGFLAANNTEVEKGTNGLSEASTSAQTEKLPYDRSNFEEVREYVRDVVLNQIYATSIKVLHEIYGLGIGRLIFMGFWTVIMVLKLSYNSTISW